ncbi:sugar and other transporter [Haladaptatus sp. W1]|uniref:MFS transporter n=1 Tax=Haladaptatus sp. W1 TaxID=1897478 RepID=UPI000849D849|nr:MFS transporter [Haladaptatus sp. W1]ODR80120.1 sugar and other transporter [Haladaptatus sp. W1]
MSSRYRSLSRQFRETVRGLRGDGRGWVLVAVAIGWAFTLGMRFIIPTLLPQIESTFHISDALAGLAITTLWIGYALMQFPAGVLVNRLGERTLLTASLCLSGVSMLVLGVAPIFGVFFVGSAAYGLGSGLYGPSRGTVLSRTFTRNAGAAFGVTLAIGSLGSAFLPNVAATVVAAVGWRAILAGLAVPFFVMAALAWRVVPERPSERSDADASSADGDANADADAVSDGGESATLPDFRELLGTLSDRSILLATLSVAILLFVYQGITAFLPSYLQTKGLSQGTAALLFGFMFVTGAASQIVAGSAADRLGIKPVLLVVTAIGVAAPIALTLVSGTLALVVVVGILGTRMAVNAVTNAYIVGALPDHIEGSAWGFIRTGFFLVGSLGSTFVGFFADANRFDLAFVILGALSAVALGLYALLPSE